ncbi:glycosyltransferase [Candidimonas humi]|uniref:Glycosyltransferase n=1 Tax=Candidimonas humi TaxID=683355 RepID=A0ABV8NWZ6_9BURK|nr:glycosyltransferase [Candidimonas humi]MBV6304447.1 glycosyltransferase [Candidimonas humi]
MKSLLQIYQEHHGNTSDKWGIYLSEYDRLFSSYRESPLSLLEIGVQNGGSLEIWGEYFGQAKAIVGCDINPDCGKLKYVDPKISLIVGDANTDESERQILAHAGKFDLIIDDGSHTSGDIVRTFARYFQHLSDGGLFVVEDLHCSYWQEFDGGLYDPYSSISFFKQLVDVVNYEHWGVEKKPDDVLEVFLKHFGCAIERELLSRIHSIEFINSLCVIRRAPAQENLLGHRYIVGEEENVVKIKGVAPLSSKQATLPQINNPWTARAFHPMEEVERQRTQIVEQEGRLRSYAQDLAMLREANSGQEQEIRHLTETVSAQELQANEHRRAIESLSVEIHTLRHSRSWRITAPLRWPMDQARRAKQVLSAVKSGVNRAGGVKYAAAKAWGVYRNEGLVTLKSKLKANAGREKEGAELSVGGLLPRITRLAEEALPLRVLIIAELSIPQCVKYRVTQKEEMLNSLGIPCTTLNWTHTEACFDALSTHSVVIFYRTPAVSSVLQLLAEARRLKMRTLWEVDDLIFDRNLLASRRALHGLDPSTFDGVLEGADLYRKTMLSCDQAIASTPGLANAMHSSSQIEDVFVVENALDEETLRVAQEILDQRCAKKGTGDAAVRIVYGSGTNTHNSDFKVASLAIAKILHDFLNVRLRIIGMLDIPEELNGYREQIEIIPFCSYPEYLQHLSESDISIAPLENEEFNDAKSNIKYLEASIIQIPSVCSPRDAFRSTIKNGVNGFLAEDDVGSWYHALKLLISDGALREQIGVAARNDVINSYSPLSIATRQLRPIFVNAIKANVVKAKRVLSVNIYYGPRSYGGATIVAEQVNNIVNEGDSAFNVYVFTTLPTAGVPAYGIRRYEYRGGVVFGVGLPDALDPLAQFQNRDMVKPFLEVLDIVRPDIVHFHSIQGIGISIIDACEQRGIPTVITLHDAWWLCGRQYMVNRQGKFCGQTRIDLDICARCVDDKNLNSIRQRELRSALNKATLLVSPSEYFADFYIQNGVPKEKLRVNKNGIKPPRPYAKYKRPGPLVFAYVGGKTDIKGYSLVKESFSDLPVKDDIKLVIVDNTYNLGFPSYSPSDISGEEWVEIVPAYTQETIDEFFNGVDVLLFPTRAKESFGLVVREAIARNVWVISTDSGGAVEDIVPGKNGTIIPLEADKADLIAAVLDVIKRYSSLNVGDEIGLNGAAITTSQEQAIQLVGIFNEAVEES